MLIKIVVFIIYYSTTVTINININIENCLETISVFSESSFNVGVFTKKI